MPSNVLDLKSLAQIAKKARGSRTYRIVSEETGLHQKTIEWIEKGRIVDAPHLIIMCKWLGIPADHFSKLGEAPFSKKLIISYLFEDKTLPEKTREALIQFVSWAYRQALKKNKKGTAPKIQYKRNRIITIPDKKNAINSKRLAETVRIKRGMRSVSYLEKEIGGISESTIARIERGNYVPDANNLTRISAWLEVPIDFFTTFQTTPSLSKAIIKAISSDKILSSDTKKALIEMMKLAYEGKKKNRS